MEEHYMSLITEYIDGDLSEARKKEFDSYVAEGHIDMEEVQAMVAMQVKMTEAEAPIPSEALSERFYGMLAAQKTETVSQPAESTFRKVWMLLFGTNQGRLAFGFAILIIGVVLGRTFSGAAYNRQLTQLSAQVADMQEMMMMSMLEEESVTERLKGVQMSSELANTDKHTVTEAMFVTLNTDESTNVRMAALNLLAQYADDPKVREGLINSISNQESPLMQVALAELMVVLQEEKAKEAFKNIIEGEYTPEEVKTTLRENLEKIM